MPKTMAPPTGAEIRAAREARDLSIKKLAELADVRWVTLRDWEAGRRAPRYETMRKVIEALNRTKPLPKIGDDAPKA